MLSSFINPVVNPDSALGVQPFDETEPIQLWPNRSEAEVDVVIRAVYRQVLGNAHVMESERLVALESQLRQGGICVREFVRQVAQSDLYRTLFFETCSRIRSIELNFKHLLGRAPESAEEIAEHGQWLDQYGFEAEIDSYIDSDEYQQAFGEDIVPYYRGYKTQAGKKMVGFTHLFQLLRGSASSDKDLAENNRARLNASLMRDRPSAIAPIQGTPFPRRRFAAATTGSETSGLKPGLSDRSWISTTTPTMAPDDAKRQKQFYQAYQPFKETAPVELCPGCSDAEAEIVIRAVYRQVLGNAHVMESERLVTAESQLKRGELSVREFVRQLAKSALYRARCFDDCYRYRAIELNYKHLLGRAPDNFEEMRYHSAVLDQSGFEADIDTYLDSDEYQINFGEATVPYYRGYRTQPGQSLLEFTNLFQLLRSSSSSDKDLATRNKPQLTRALIRKAPYGKLKVRDVSEIIAEALRPKSPFAASSQSGVSRSGQSVAEQALQQTVQQQSGVITRLRQQLAELRPFASIGASYLNSDWRLAGAVTDPDADPDTPPLSLQQQADVQATQIATLQDQLADARRHATIGEARLNKWQSRFFRG